MSNQLLQIITSSDLEVARTATNHLPALLRQSALRAHHLLHALLRITDLIVVRVPALALRLGLLLLARLARSFAILRLGLGLSAALDRRRCLTECERFRQVTKMQVADVEDVFLVGRMRRVCADV